MQRRLRVVEIVGPAGAGKTTLLRALSQCDQRIRECVRPLRISYIPYFVSIAFSLLPTYLHQYMRSRWFTREELRGMVYLKAWHQALTQQAPSSDMVTVLDHGPIFRLAWLNEFGPEITKSASFERWWDGMLNQWALTLDLVIWLDAPDPVLFRRIQTRERWHLVKMRSEQEAYQFLHRSRTSHGQVISKMLVRGGPTLLRFDTNHQGPDETANQVLAALDL